MAWGGFAEAPADPNLRNQRIRVFWDMVAARPSRCCVVPAAKRVGWLLATTPAVAGRWAATTR